MVPRPLATRHRDVIGTANEILDDYHIGRPNSTQLAEGIRKSRLASESKKTDFP